MEHVAGLPTPQDAAISRMNHRCEEIRRLYKGHPDCKDLSIRLEFVHKDWLRDWMKEGIPKPDTYRKVIDNRSLLCQHGKICLSKIPDLKCTTADLAAETWNRYDRNPQLTNDDLCRQCVKEKIISVKRGHQIQEDGKSIQDNLKKRISQLDVLFCGNIFFQDLEGPGER